jgi:hypothetical protein
MLEKTVRSLINLNKLIQEFKLIQQLREFKSLAEATC